jgi:hypothetical protein
MIVDAFKPTNVEIGEIIEAAATEHGINPFVIYAGIGAVIFIVVAWYRGFRMPRPDDSVTLIWLATGAFCIATDTVGLAHVLCGSVGYLVGWILRLPPWWRLAIMFLSGLDLNAGIAGAILAYFIEPWKEAKDDVRRTVRANQRQNRAGY